MKRPKLGQIITASDRIRRHYGGRHRRDWSPCRAIFKPKPITGIYIGWRTYSNGEVHYDEGAEYTADHWFEAWLIVRHPRQKPVPVLPGDIV